MLGSANDILPVGKVRPRGIIHLGEDIRNLAKGVLDFKGFLSGYRMQTNPVEAIFRGPCTHSHAHLELLPPDLRARGCQTPNGPIKAIRRQHNLRVTQGRDSWQRLLMAGDITANATSYTGASGAATATGATSLTNSGAAFPTSGGANAGLIGHIVVCMAAGVPAVYGVIVSNTATVLTIDQWTSVSSGTGAAGSTPGSTSEYWVTPWAGPAIWVGLSTSTATPAAGDVLRTADGLYGDGTGGGAATEQNASGLTRVYLQPTFGSGTYVLTNTWTYTGSGAITLAKVVLCNTKPTVGGLLAFETLLSAQGTVTANGDTIQVTWTITL